MRTVTSYVLAIRRRPQIGMNRVEFDLDIHFRRSVVLTGPTVSYQPLQLLPE